MLSLCFPIDALQPFVLRPSNFKESATYPQFSLNEINVQPKSDRPVPVHSLVPEKDENIAPTVCYTSDLKALYPAKGFEEVAVARKKAQYYEDAFTARGSHNSPQDRVTQDSFVVAELKTNKMVGLVCTCQS